MAVQLWAEPLQKRYFAPRLSLSYIFWLGYYITLVLIPFYAAYNSYEFWKKESTYREQPTFGFTHSFVAVLQGKRPENIYTWSNIAAYQQFVDPSQMRAPSVQVSEVDTNVDGLADEFHLKMTMNVADGEEIHRAMLFLFFNVELRDRVRMIMTGMTTVQGESFYPGSALNVHGDLRINAVEPLSSTNSRTVYNSPILDPNNITSIQDILPATLLANYAQRNETLRIETRVPPLWVPGASDTFTINLNLQYSNQLIPYIPGVAETLKFAWIQYVALFLILSFFMNLCQEFVYRFQIVPTRVILDTTPKEKVHQW